MVAAALALGLAGGLGADELVGTFNAGFGRALGEFALILLPSFVLAACLSRAGVATAGAGRAAAFAAPAAGAGMICPDTAYAALSPAAGRRKLDVAFGAYAGFKLLYPAGPLIVATGLGVLGPDGRAAELALMGAALTLPVWAAGALWIRLAAPDGAASVASQPESAASRTGLVAAFAPFALLAVLLVMGGVAGPTGLGALDFVLMPKGALVASALLALAQTASGERRACWDGAVRRTGGLLLVIGTASAFGAVLTALAPLADIVPTGSGIATLLGLFALTAAFKLVQGSSMATFAAVAPVAAPVVLASGVHPASAVFAICLGSFIAILPNDSYYWLVRRDALEAEKSDLRAVRLLTGGAVVQAVVGMAIVIGAALLWTWSAPREVVHLPG
ncbi:MAG: permease [Pseudomonadota bacterium]